MQKSSFEIFFQTKFLKRPKSSTTHSPGLYKNPCNYSMIHPQACHVSTRHNSRCNSASKYPARNASETKVGAVRYRQIPEERLYRQKKTKKKKKKEKRKRKGRSTCRRPRKERFYVRATGKRIFRVRPRKTYKPSSTSSKIQRIRGHEEKPGVRLTPIDRARVRERERECVCACERERERNREREKWKQRDENGGWEQERGAGTVLWFGGGFRCEGLGRPMESPEG